MNLSQINNSTNFGMKFRVTTNNTNPKLSVNPNQIFNEVQLALIKRKIESLEPKTDEFVLTLKQPSMSVFKTLDKKLMIKKSYDMDVEILGKNSKRNYNISENNINLELSNTEKDFIDHSQGPYSKLMDFISRI